MTKQNRSQKHSSNQKRRTALKALPHRQSFLERVAVSYLRRRADIKKHQKISPQEDPIHVITKEEHQKLKRVVTRTVLRSLLAGVCNALIIAVLDIFSEMQGVEALQKYLFLGLVGLSTTTIEILYLYRSHLIAVHNLSSAAGANLFSEEELNIGEALARVMGRAALEVPDPIQVVEGIDPRREASRVGLTIAIILYKLKRGLTNFFVKFLIRQVASRSVLRTFIPFIALPITGAWNALISYRILREARIRVIGPSAAKDFINFLSKEIEISSQEVKIMLLRAVGVVMVQQRKAHPNLLSLLQFLAEKVGSSITANDLDDVEKFLQNLSTLSSHEQRLALTVLQIASVLDGTLSRREREFVQTALVQCDLPASLETLQTLLHSFISGQSVQESFLENMLGVAKENLVENRNL